MKRIFFALCILAAVLAAPQQGGAETDVSLDFFYDNLGDGGNWIEVEDYGYCWQPNVAVSNTRWRPYSDGYWVYTDVGWTWVSNEDFGWATYHYGRWARIQDQGWVWVPGREWGPAWVSWRTGGDYVGWAPLPPHRGGGAEVVYEGRPIDSRVDIDFDIGPAYYNFVDVRYIGEPVLRDRIFEPEQNVTYISRTVNVTNITYNNSSYYNHGPDYHRLSAYSTRQIPRLTLERERNVDLRAAARSRGLTRVQGDRLMVAAPVTFQKPTQQIAPKVVKKKIARPNLERGWAGVTDPKTKAELQERFKTEDSKAVPPPDLKPTNPAALNAASPGASSAAVSPVPQATPAPAEDKRGRNNPVVPPLALQPDGTPVPADASAAPVPNESKGKRKDPRNKQDANGQPGLPAATPPVGSTTSPAAETSAPVKPEQDGKGKNKSDRLRSLQPAPAITPDESGIPAGESKVPPGTPRDTRKAKDKRPAPTVDPAITAPADGDGGMSRAGDRPDRGLYAPSSGVNADQKKGEGRKSQRTDVPPPSDPGAGAASAPVQAPLQEKPRRVEQRKPQVPQQQVAPSSGQAAPQQGGGKPEKGKKNKKGEEEPAPSPGQ